MDLFTQAITLAAPAVLVLTELLKFVPVRFTTDYPAWVNAILSVIASIIVIQPTFNLSDIGATLGTALLIGFVAAAAYNQFTSRLTQGGKV